MSPPGPISRFVLEQASARRPITESVCSLHLPSCAMPSSLRLTECVEKIVYLAYYPAILFNLSGLFCFPRVVPIPPPIEFNLVSPSWLMP